MSRAPGQSPELEWVNHQEAVPVNLDALQSAAGRALPLSRTEAAAAPLPPEIGIALVDDAEIAELHERFLDDPTPTDVITFQHGEIVISVDTAAREAAARGWPLERELLLYAIHGFLHLQGLDDREEAGRARMQRIQEAILDEVWPVS